MRRIQRVLQVPQISRPGLCPYKQTAAPPSYPAAEVSKLRPSGPLKGHFTHAPVMNLAPGNSEGRRIIYACLHPRESLIYVLLLFSIAKIQESRQEVLCWKGCTPQEPGACRTGLLRFRSTSDGVRQGQGLFRQQCWPCLFPYILTTILYGGRRLTVQ